MLRIIIPAYNEAGRIERTLDEYCPFFGSSGTITVVANGCTDATARVVRTAMERHSNLEILEIPSAIGKGGAVRAGLSVGDEDFVGYVDADGSIDARSFAGLVDACRGEGVAAVVGSRWLSDSVVTTRQPALRRALSRAFNLLVRMLFGLPFRDTQCGAKIFRRKAISQIGSELELTDFAFDVEILFALRRRRYVILERAVRCADVPPSSVHPLRLSFSILWSLLRLRLRRARRLRN